MPLIVNEPDLYPESLFDLSVERAPWRVAHVRSRCEKALARLLHDQGVPFYLPLQEKRLEHAGRVRVSRPPLFPGYVFLRGGRSERLTALQTRRVVRIVEVDDQDRLASELRELRRLQEDGFLLIPHPYLEPGDPVEILEGSFRGYRGRVVRERGEDRLVIAVRFLRRSVSVEMDRDGLRPLNVDLAGYNSEAGSCKHRSSPALRAP